MSDEKFWERVNLSGGHSLEAICFLPQECWLWTGKTSTKGYGVMPCGRYGKAMKAHRYAYSRFVGPLVHPLVIDHLCRRHNCVNPSHLEQVTVRENNLRGKAPGMLLHKINACKRGHALVEGNMYVYQTRRGGVFRQCRTCALDRAAGRI